MAGHDEYSKLDAGKLKRLMAKERPVIVDGRNVIEPEDFIYLVFVYKGIGRGDKNDHLIKSSVLC